MGHLASGAKPAHAAVPCEALLWSGGDYAGNPVPPSCEGATRRTALGAISYQELLSFFIDGDLVIVYIITGIEIGKAIVDLLIEVHNRFHMVFAGRPI